MREQQRHQHQFIEVDSSQDFSKEIRAVKIQARNSYLALGFFVIILIIVILFRQYSNQRKIDFFEKQLLKRQVPDIWKMTLQERQEQQKKKDKNMAGSQKYPITRQQLGRNSWTLLHMIAASFPENIPNELTQQFNAFLVLFAKMYPCKLCSNHFMQLLNRNELRNLFTGSTKDQLMRFMCRLHNMVNKDLGKQLFECSKVAERWNTCGCGSQ